MAKVAVITGASYGIGEATCKRILELGYKVYGISRSKPKVSNADFTWLKIDLSKDDELSSIQQLISESSINLLINNVGTDFHQKALKYTDQSFDQMFNLNFRVPVKLTTLLFPKLSGGTIVNISSLSDRYPEANYGLYCASKTALNLFFESMAEEESGVKIVSVLPSYVDTPLQHKIREGESNFDWSWCMQPEDVAECIANIVIDHSKYETGSRIIVEKKQGENAPYNPEKLFVYGVDTKRVSKIR